VSKEYSTTLGKCIEKLEETEERWKADNTTRELK
jgi:hypothetical protein